MQLTPEQMEVIRAHGGSVTRLQVNMLGGTSGRNAMIRKKDGRNVWFPDDDVTPIKIEDDDEIELIPQATNRCNCEVCRRGRSHAFTGGISGVARLGGNDERDTSSDQVPKLWLVRDLDQE